MKAPQPVGQAVSRLQQQSASPPSSSPPNERCCRLEGYRPKFSEPLPHLRRVLAETNPALWRVMEDCAAARSPWPLFVHGPVGTGKTRFGLLGVDEFGGWFQTLAKLCRLDIEAMNGRLRWSSGYLRPRQGIWDDTRACHLFVLDEVGMKPVPSSFEYDCLKWVLDSRENRPLIILSNFDVDELGQLYDERMRSRLRAGTDYHLTGPDRRVERKEQ